MAFTIRRATKSLASSNIVISVLLLFWSGNFQLYNFCLFLGISNFCHFLVVIMFFPAFLVFKERHLYQSCLYNKSQVYNVSSIIKNEGPVSKIFSGSISISIRRLRWFIILIFIGWVGYGCFVTVGNLDIKPTLFEDDKMEIS